MVCYNNLVTNTIDVIKEFITKIESYGYLESGNLCLSATLKDIPVDPLLILIEELVCKLQINVQDAQKNENPVNVKCEQRDHTLNSQLSCDDICDLSKDASCNNCNKQDTDNTSDISSPSNTLGKRLTSTPTCLYSSDVTLSSNNNIASREFEKDSGVSSDRTSEREQRSEAHSCSVIQHQFLHSQDISQNEHHQNAIAIRNNLHTTPERSLELNHVQKSQDLHPVQSEHHAQHQDILHQSQDNEEIHSLGYVYNTPSISCDPPASDAGDVCTRTTAQLIQHVGSFPGAGSLPTQLTCSKCNMKYYSTTSPTPTCHKSDNILCDGCSRNGKKTLLTSDAKLPENNNSKGSSVTQCSKDSKSFPSSSKKHSCDKCGRVFSMWKHLSIHLNKVHVDEEGTDNSSEVTTSPEVLPSECLPLYCCKTCNITCLTPQSFNTHPCRLPTDESNNSLSNRILITNIVKLRQMRKFVCETCGLEYRNFKHISYHLPRCIAGPYPCNICYVMFDTKRLLNYHKKKMHKGKKCFVCDECGRSFQRRTSLRKHEINWHESGTAVGPFKCDLCPKKFIKRIYLTNHKLRMHSLNKKFLCQVCGNKFMTQNSLMAHMVIHSDVSKFECSYCKKQFKRKDKLIHHERLHTGERPFLCQLCGSGFVSKCKLSAHIGRHYGTRRYRCPHCTNSYAGNWDLKQHIKKIHSKELEKSTNISMEVSSTVTPETCSQIEEQVTEASSSSSDSTTPGARNNPKKEAVFTTGVDHSSEGMVEEEAVNEESSSSMLGNPQYIAVGSGVTMPVVAGPVQSHLPALGNVVQVSGSSVPLTGMNATLTPANTSVQTMQAIQAVPGAEYSVHTIQPPTIHTAQGYIFTQSFDMVSGTIQY